MDTSLLECQASSMRLADRIKNVKATSKLSMMPDIQRLCISLYCLVLDLIRFYFLSFYFFLLLRWESWKTLYSYYCTHDWLMLASWFCGFSKKRLSQVETFICQINLNDFSHQFYSCSNSLTDQNAGNHGWRENIMQMQDLIQITEF